MNEDTFVTEIIEAPDDDVPRLVFADWLEDHGQEARAGFIRAQCELARLRYDDPRFSELQAQGYRLLSRHFTAWRGAYSHVKFRRGFVERLEFCHPEDFVEA